MATDRERIDKLEKELAKVVKRLDGMKKPKPPTLLPPPPPPMTS